MVSVRVDSFSSHRGQESAVPKPYRCDPVGRPVRKNVGPQVSSTLRTRTPPKVPHTLSFVRGPRSHGLHTSARSDTSREGEVLDLGWKEDGGESRVVGWTQTGFRVVLGSTP